MPTSLKIFVGDVARQPTLRVGSRLDKYRIQRRLGEGGFATVYGATDLIEDRKVALKIPDGQHIADASALEDTHREVRIMAQMDHPHILSLKDARFIDGHFVMVFPLADETLADRMTRRMSRATAIDLIVQMVGAVAYAHQRKILHRDIKPDNFVLFADQTLQLTDFGLARIERGGHQISASGTVGYMSPEQAMGKPNYRSDVFSLGLVMYRMLSGEMPEFPFERLPGYNKFRRGLSQDFMAIVRKAIDPSPNKRFRDAVAMNNAISRIRYPLSDRSVTLTETNSAGNTVTVRRVA